MPAERFRDLVYTGQDGSIVIRHAIGDGTFAAPVNVTLPALGGNGDASATSIVDINSDGVLDIVAVMATPRSINIGIGNGSGGYSFSNVTYPTTLIAGPLASGDFNGDGRTDLVTPNENFSTPGVFGLLLNNGSGGFTTSLVTLAGVNDPLYRMTAADLDGDGDLDLVATAGDKVLILANDGSGNFTRTATGTAPIGADIVVADLNNDGVKEIIVAASERVTILTTGGIARSVSLPGAGVEDVAAADFDGDGDMDLFTINRITDNASLLKNDGAGNFTLTTLSLGGGKDPISLWSGDLDGDGDIDVVTINDGSSLSGGTTVPPSSTLFRNNGDGTFAVSLVAGATFSQLTDQVVALNYNQAILGGAGADTLNGNAWADRLDGLGGNDTLNGAAGYDELYGGDGNDTLIGGSGNDVMYGGLGDDTFEVTEAGDVVVETAGQGSDTIFSYVTYALGANVENLRLVGAAVNATGNGLNNVIVGNAMNNTLVGGGGNDSMYGGTGNDTYEVTESGDVIVENGGEGSDTVFSYVTYTLSANVESLRLVGSALNGYGNALDNILVGNALNNTLIGGAGNDAMYGGAGNDTYEFTEAGDVAIENASEGVDTIFSYVTYTLGANVENLRLVGTALNATGNALDNMVVGNALNNVLIGGAGNDIMVGSTGDDAYEVTEGGDIVYEAAGEGNDTVYSYADTYQMSLNVETMNLVGGARVGLGSAGNDTINGNAQYNVLNGNAGNDTLTGGGGVDQFWHLGAGAGVDTITDFAAAAGETIVLSQLQFANFAAVQAKMVQSGANVIIAFNGSQSLTLQNVTIGQLSAANFSFYSGPGAAPSETPGKHDGPQVMPHDEAVGGPAAEHDAFVLPVASEKTWTPLTLPDTHDLGGSGEVFSGPGFGGLDELASLAAFDHMPFGIDASLIQTHHFDF